MFNFGDIATGLRNVISAADMLGPFGSMIGLDKITGLIKIGLDIAENVTDRAKEANVVLNSQEQDQIDAIIVELRAKNDELAQQIDES